MICRPAFSAVVFAAVCAISLAAEDAPERPDPWKQHILKKLDYPITVELDAPLADSLSFLSNIGVPAVIVDPRLPQAAIPEIKVKVRNTALSALLTKIMNQADMEYELRDEALFAFKRGTYAHKKGKLDEQQTKSLKQSIADLGATEFAVREQASQAIAALGEAAKPELEAAAAHCEDSEQLLRIQRALAAIRANALFTELPEVTEELDRLQQRVTFAFDQMTATDAAKALSDMAGAQKLNIECGLGNELTFKVSKMKLGNALRWLARLCDAQILLEGNRIRIVKVPSP